MLQIQHFYDTLTIQLISGYRNVSIDIPIRTSLQGSKNSERDYRQNYSQSRRHLIPSGEQSGIAVLLRRELVAADKATSSSSPETRNTSRDEGPGLRKTLRKQWSIVPAENEQSAIPATGKITQAGAFVFRTMFLPN